MSIRPDAPDEEPARPESFASARVIAELAREGQLAQLGEIDGLDQKAATLVGFAGVILGLLFTSGYAADHWSLALTVGAAALAASLLPLGAAVVPRDYRFDPNVAALEELYLHRTPEQTQV